MVVGEQPSGPHSTYKVITNHLKVQNSYTIKRVVDGRRVFGVLGEGDYIVPYICCGGEGVYTALKPWGTLYYSGKGKKYCTF